MERNSFAYDVFISAADGDRAVGKDLQESLRKSGLRTYLYTEHRVADAWEKKILDALPSSEYFIVLASPEACTSEWVQREHKIFSDIEAKDPSRKIFRMRIGKGCPALLPSDIVHADSIEALAPEVVRYHVEQRRSDCDALNSQVKDVQAQLEKRDGEAFGHYRRSRFWRQLTNDRNVHIFTCGRDTPPDNTVGVRGSRTNIDKWDYKTVLDITHFLNRHYPSTHVHIEDPVSKLSSQDLKESWAPVRLATLQGLLANKDCIIVGSPDVSDFAEIVLAATHDIHPYQSRRVKQTGYVIIKDAAKVSAPSSQYWTTGDGETAGVAKLGGPVPELFPTRVSATGSGEMCGTLAMVANPYSRSARTNQQHHRIVILSGFSGVATNAIAKFLTDDTYLHEFGRFDREYVDVDADIEALISVSFSEHAQAVDGDRREIQDVSYRGLVVV